MLKEYHASAISGSAGAQEPAYAEDKAACLKAVRGIFSLSTAAHNHSSFAPSSSSSILMEDVFQVPGEEECGPGYVVAQRDE